MLRKLIVRILRKTVALLQRLLKHLEDGPARLNPVTNIEVEVMAKTVTIRWALPTTRVDDSPVTPSEIDLTRIQTKAKAAPDSAYTTVAEVAADVDQVAVFPNTPAGTWSFRLLAIDKTGQPADGYGVGEAVIPAAALRAVSDVSVVVE